MADSSIWIVFYCHIASIFHHKDKSNQYEGKWTWYRFNEKQFFEEHSSLLQFFELWFEDFLQPISSVGQYLSQKLFSIDIIMKIWLQDLDFLNPCWKVHWLQDSFISAKNSIFWLLNSYKRLILRCFADTINSQCSHLEIYIL